MKGKELRAKKAHLKKLKARSEAQVFNQSIWSTVAYRHGDKSFADHGKYYVRQRTDKD